MKKADVDAESLSMSSLEVICWHCHGSTVDTEPFCQRCHTILEYKGVPPFELLHIEKGFSIDLKKLERIYFDFMARLHPDRFARASNQEKSFALQWSSAFNDAYAKLKDPLKRLKTLINEEVPDIQSPIILQQAMEDQEKLVQIQRDHKAVQDFEKDVQKRIQDLYASVPNSIGTQQKKEASDLYLRLKYLDTLMRNIYSFKRKHAFTDS